MPEPPTSDQIADRLHDSMLRELARIAPVGGRSVPTNVIADALLLLLAEILIASEPNPADEVERLVALFRAQLEEALRSDPLGHA